MSLITRTQNAPADADLVFQPDNRKKENIMPKIKFLPSGTEIEARAGESLLDIALSEDVSIQHACGGFCACTTCHCEVISGIENLAPAEEDELERLSVLDGRTPSSRLTCQAKVKGDVTVRVVNYE